jgi:hypothetical protein
MKLQEYVSKELKGKKKGKSQKEWRQLFAEVVKSYKEKKMRQVI